MAINGFEHVLQEERADLLRDWLQTLTDSHAGHQGTMSRAEMEEHASGFLQQLSSSAAGGSTNIRDESWAGTQTFIEGYTRALVTKGMTAADTARFVLSLKNPLFMRLQQAHAADPAALAKSVNDSTTILDGLALQAIATYQKMREEVINRQQMELLELSTPVVKLWHGILALPLIGTLDSARTQIVMESLLQRVVEVEAEIAIIDITGVPTVDTLVAQHLLKAVTALRMMGAECIISGIRPQIAQTIVHLGVDLGGVTTKATLADALAVALKKTGHTFVKGN